MRFIAIVLLLAFCAPCDGQEAEPAIDMLLHRVKEQYEKTGDPLDIRGLAQRLGHNRQRILDFVSNEIEFEPYVGSLRGPSGTLLARAGNSLDQALLLIDLLEASGVVAQLVQKPLPPADGQKLLSMFIGRKEASDQLDPQERGKQVAALLGVEASLLEELRRTQRRESDTLVEEVLAGCRIESARLLSSKDLSLTGTRAKPPRQHYWVRLKDGGQHDLDPTGIDIERKGARSVGARTLEKLRWTVLLKLVLHRSVGRKKEAVPLMEIPLPLEKVAWKPVDLVILPGPGQLQGSAQFLGMSPADRLPALKAVKMFRPGLIVDGLPYGGAPFDMQGKTYTVNGDGRIGAAKKIGGAAARGLGGLFGSGGGAKKGPAIQLQRLELELSLRAPDGKVVVHRRDLLEKTSSRLPILRHSLLFATHALSPSEESRRVLSLLARNADAILSSVGGKPSRSHPHLGAEVSMLLMRFGAARRQVMARLIAESGKGLRVSYTQPTIVMETRQLTGDLNTGSLSVRHGLDLMQNAVTMIASDGTTAPEMALSLGVAETALESLLLVRSHPAAAAPSAWNLMARSRLSGGPLQVETKSGTARIAWSDDAWWSIELSSGSCIGRVRSGAGQGMAEYIWNCAGKICDVAVLLGVYTASGAASKGVQDLDGALGNVCAIRGGSAPRAMAAKKIKAIKDTLWQQSTLALMGMGGN